jgi:3',5'-cyclic AMP phosphodiesterase CpdA
MTLEERKRYRERANRAKRELLKEKEQYGYINDGSGKRYLAPVYYVLAGDHDKALAFYTWFEEEFSDDIGEPVFDLYWVLAEYRAGNTTQASYRLQIAMLNNLYLLPFLCNKPIGTLDIWHESTQAASSYLREIQEYLHEPTPAERQWIEAEYNSQLFETLRQEYIATYHQLKHERDVPKRKAITAKWDNFSTPLLQKPA